MSVEDIQVTVTRQPWSVPTPAWVGHRQAEMLSYPPQIKFGAEEVGRAGFKYYPHVNLPKQLPWRNAGGWGNSSTCTCMELTRIFLNDHMSYHISKQFLFTFVAAGSGLRPSTTAKPNSSKMFLKEWRSHHISRGLIPLLQMKAKVTLCMVTI